jgi:signal transduction histidine kinase
MVTRTQRSRECTSSDTDLSGYFSHTVTISYIPVHMEYILTELLKNAFRATVEHHYSLHGTSSSAPIAPVTITIAPPTSGSDVSSPFLTLRIRDEGGGVRAANMARVFSYAFTTAGGSSGGDDESGGGPYAAQHIGGSAAIDETGSPGEGSLFATITGKGLQTGLGTIAGLGYGLPMSRLYARLVPEASSILLLFLP